MVNRITAVLIWCVVSALLALAFSSPVAGKPTKTAVMPRVAGLSAPPLLVEPRVTQPGSTVSASGRCLGAPKLQVRGRAASWYDIPPVYVDTTATTDVAGDWSISFAMPVLPSSVIVTCTEGPTSVTVAVLISPASGDLMPLSGVPDGNGLLLTIPRVAQPDQLAAFTATGLPIPLTVVDSIFSGGIPSVTARVVPPDGPVRIVVVGIQSFGENANALQVSTVQGWYLEVPGSPDPPTTTAAPAGAVLVSIREPVATSGLASARRIGA